MITPRLQEGRSTLHRSSGKLPLRPQDLPAAIWSKKLEITDLVTNLGEQREGPDFQLEVTFHQWIGQVKHHLRAGGTV